MKIVMMYVWSRRMSDCDVWSRRMSDCDTSYVILETGLAALDGMRHLFNW